MKLLIFLMMAAFACAGNSVLLIIADDYGVDAQSLYNPGGTTAPTPNINGLAAGGVRFTQAYACPVCSPTRAAILTGRYGFRTGVGDVVSAASALTAAELTLPEIITQNGQLGISAASFGKWHLSGGSATSVRNFPNTIGGWPHYAGATSGVLGDYMSWQKTTNGVISTSLTYATSDVVNDAVAWITEKNQNGGKWLAWVAFNAPHTPFHVPPVNLHSYGANLGSNSLKYRAAVEAMDTEIGRLLAAVKPATTDVIFIGDNGTPGQVVQTPYDSAHAKGSLYEGGTRVPFIIKGPSVSAGGRTDGSLVHVVDLFSTLLEMAGVPVPATLVHDSKSLLPILANQGDDTRSRLYLELFDASAASVGGRALRDDRYKLIRLNTGVDQFFDLLESGEDSTNLLVNGVGAMTATRQAHYYRLRFDLGGYTSGAVVSPLRYSRSESEFSLVVAEDSGVSQTLWQSEDLDFWVPVSNAAPSVGQGELRFSVPFAEVGKGFFSVLSE